MGKIYSTTYDRACNILLFMIDKQLASWTTSHWVYSVRCPELSKVMKVSKPMIYDALNLLIDWGHVKKLRSGRKTYYIVTDRGFEWVEKHEAYVEQRAEIDRAVIEVNNG